MKKNTLVVMGNGPSLKSIDFDLLGKFDTFGLNSAYRAYGRLNWWPTYHGCFDFVVTDSHRDNFADLTLKNNPIKRFFYLEKLSNSKRLQKITLFRTGYAWNSSESDFKKFSDGGNSGVNACQIGVCLGYKKIILVGVDCNYKEMIDGAKQVKDGNKKYLEMSKTPNKNSNYWFDDYQQKGDKFNLPQENKFHRPAWDKLAVRSKNNGIDIVNCSPGTTLKCFRLSRLEDEA